jgi:acyl-coenzyme A synthetase/AMP-(fatty) acid ligase
MNIPLLCNMPAARVFAFDRHNVVTAGQYLVDVAELAERLPAESHVLNDCLDRYRFLVAFGAAIVRGQVSLLPPARVAHVWGQMAEDFPGTYCITDQAERPDVMPVMPFPERTGVWSPGMPVNNPEIPVLQNVAVAFTSGSTGRPKPMRKCWGICVDYGVSAARSVGVVPGEPGALVATSPSQHLYGFIVAAMMPLQCGLAVNRDNPFFAEDMRLTLEAAPYLPIFATTPVQLRSCVLEKTKLPPLRFILSSTAPLARSLAEGAEAQFNTRLLEFYGSTECGAIAYRRQKDTDVWHTFDRVRVKSVPQGFRIDWDEFETAVLSDVVEILNEREFRLLGRDTDMVKIGGKRTSIAYLNQQLQEIVGVVDGAFLLEESQDEGREPRLTAFVNAPTLTRETVIAALRARVEAVFVPKRLFMVPRLPRNATGKLPRDSMVRLRQELEQQES